MPENPQDQNTPLTLENFWKILDSKLVSLGIPTALVGIELKTVFVLASLHSIKQHLATFKSCEAEFAIITTNSDMVAISSFEFTRLTGHISSGVFITSLMPESLLVQNADQKSKLG
ncbi:MAG: hypothetical protein ACREPR_12825 [Brasilonema sp.]